MAVLNRLILKDFRNYESIDLEFADGINVFLGANGQGKSNLLEAIYFLSILRSFRCSKVKNLFNAALRIIFSFNSVLNMVRSDVCGSMESRFIGPAILSASSIRWRLYQKILNLSREQHRTGVGF